MIRPRIFHLLLITASLIQWAVSIPFPTDSSPPTTPTINTYDPEHGVFIGRLQPAGREYMDGLVYAINDTTLQIVNFTFSSRIPDAFFMLDASSVASARDGVRVPTNEYGDSPLGFYPPGSRVVLSVPDERKVNSHKTLSVHAFSTQPQMDSPLASVSIPDNLISPRSQFLHEELRAPRYSIAGLVQIVDMRTIRIVGFSFEGQKAPDGYFFVGRGLNVTKEAGVKVPIRGRDTHDLITPMSERYSGGRDVVLDLPEGYDIRHIDFLSIYCFNFDVDYAHVYFRNISRYNLPPHVPEQRRYTDVLDAAREEAWNLSNLLGTLTQLNFTFQLGPNGGKRGYAFVHRVARPPRHVWYVNGYLANLYLKRGVTYNFIVEGGMNASRPEFNNPLYLSSDSYGGYAKFTNAESRRVKIYAPSPADGYAGRLCRWMPDDAEVMGNGEDEESAGPRGMNSRDVPANNRVGDIGVDFGSFIDFRTELGLKCEAGGNVSAAVFQFTPTAETPSELYFNSHTNYQMGSKIFIVDEFPSDLKFIVEEPYRYDARQHKAKESLMRENSATATSLSLLSSVLFVLLASLLLG